MKTVSETVVLTLTVLTLAVLGGCRTVGSYQHSSSNNDGEIVLIRKSSMNAVAARAVVQIDGRNIVKIPNRSYIRLSIHSGRHELAVASEFYYLSDLYRPKFDRIEIVVKADDTLYFEVSANPKRWGILADPTGGLVVDEAVQPFLLKESSFAEFQEAASSLKQIPAPVTEPPANASETKPKR